MCLDILLSGIGWIGSVTHKTVLYSYSRNHSTWNVNSESITPFSVSTVINSFESKRMNNFHISKIPHYFFPNVGKSIVSYYYYNALNFENN